MRLDHFGVLAPIYDRVIRAPDVGRLRALADLTASDRLLDMGGGTGRVLAHLRNGVAAAWIADASLGMLRQAHERGLGTCQGYAEAAPFRDGAFTKIVAVDSFHHFPNQDGAAHELLRVLAPGGRLVIEEPDIRHFAVKLVALGERLAMMRSHFRYSEELVTLFTMPATSVSVHTGPHTYWIVIDKHV